MKIERYYCLAAICASVAGAASLWAGSEGLALLLFAVSAFLNATGTSAALDQLYDRQ